MVSPIDYTMDVLSPIEGYMQGLKFGEGIQTDRLNRELAQSQEGRTQETFAMAKQDRARSIASAQAAQQNAAAAQAGLVDYVNKLEAGTATPAELRAAMLKFPKMAETFQAFSQSVSAERLATETTFAKQLAFALQRDPEQAKLLLETRADAALASGDQKASDVARAQIIQIDQNPNAVLTQALMPLVTTMKPDEFDKFYTEVLGIGGGEENTEAFNTLDQQLRGAGFVPRAEGGDGTYETTMAAKVGVGGPQEGELSLTDIFAQEEKLRKEYNKRTSDLTSSRRNLSIIKTSAADNSGAGDIALVTSFMKMLDPGSVVRESEFAQAAGAGGLFAKLKALQTQIVDGQFLSVDQRKDFSRLAGQYLAGAQAEEKTERESYAIRVKNYGLNPYNVFPSKIAEEILTLSNSQLPAVAPVVAPAVAPAVDSAVDSAVNVLTKKEFFSDPSIIYLDPDLKESVWLNYKKIKGIE